MAVEQIREHLYRFEPGPADAHTHPRAFDAMTEDNFMEDNQGREGKAGLAVYTEVALESGITAMYMMPNESLRRYSKINPELTELVPYPLSNIDRILATEALISHEAVIPVAIHMGVDPTEIFQDVQRNVLDHGVLHQRFFEAGEEVVALKLYGDETEGGYNVDPKHLPDIIRIWHQHYPDKPVILHLEDDNVGRVLNEVNNLENGKEIPIHIAHVSSREELEAVIQAKEMGMNVSCEVTVHHLFLDASVRDEIGGYGCVKPSLKTQKDIDFLWANMKYIDIIASDCAPHRRSDKLAAKPSPGMTTHTVMLPLLFGAILDGKLTHQELYQKLCINPRKRFNLPIHDRSFIEYHTNVSERDAKNHRLHIEQYGYNPFRRLDRNFKMIGRVVNSRAGTSYLNVPNTSYTHLIRPHNIGLAIARNERIV